MNSSYDEVLRKSTSTWIFQRMELVLEFSRKQITPVPFNIVHIVLQVFKSTCSCRANWCSLQFTQQSDLERLKECFGTNTVPEFSEMYNSDKKMASLYHDIYGEFVSVRNCFEKRTDVHYDLESEHTKRADYMRSCAELSTAMCTKRMYQEQDHMAKLHSINSNTKNDWDFDLNDVQQMLVRLQQKICIESKDSNLQKEIEDIKRLQQTICIENKNSNLQVQKEIEDIKNHIDNIVGSSLSKNKMQTKRSTLLLPLPTGST